LDEAQDITSLYYELVCKIYKDNQTTNPTTPPKICVFGDKKQSIFDFNKADQRFIEYATELFNFNSYNWSRCNLPVSFRITYEMSLFINVCCLKEERILSKKISHNKPRYIICDYFADRADKHSRTLEEVRYYLDLGYKPDEIFILAPSVKGKGKGSSQKSPIQCLENRIKKEMPNVMVYVPTNDDEKLDEHLLQGKLIFSTFHQTKGLERKVVIIFNFDCTYFKYYKKNTNPCVCPNELYVATTRGIDHLTLFHHYKNDYLPFLDHTNIQLYCHFEGNIMPNSKNNAKESPEKSPQKQIPVSVTDIFKFLPQNVIDECYYQLEITKNSSYTKQMINIPITVSNEHTIECVSEITGIALPSMLELKLKNKMTIYEELVEQNFEREIIQNEKKSGCLIQLDDMPFSGIPEHKNKKYNIHNIDIQNITPDELLYIANCWNTFKNGFLFKIYQITNYGWLEKEKLDECIHRLSLLDISCDSMFEHKLLAENEYELSNFQLIGRVDCIDIKKNIMYEFKCVHKIEKEHFLQLALYMYMYELSKKNQTTKENDIINEKTEYVLINIITNEYMTINCEFEKLRKMIGYLIHSKYAICKPITDGEFIKNNRIIYKKFFE